MGRARTDPLAQFIDPVVADLTISESAARCLRVAASELWPAGAGPVWPQLENAGFGREEFLAFCDRFVIEVALPRFSADFARPGPIENALTALHPIWER